MIEAFERVRTEVRRVVVGQEQTVDLALIAACTGGHVLLEGPPGVAKTLAVNALAEALGLRFRACSSRRTCSPRTSPGTMTLRAGELAFRPGPVFTNVLLADEINRTPPKTQAALLEAMQERQVTRRRRAAAAARPVPRDRDPEPDRARGHLSAARGPARPLPVQARRRLSRRGGGAGHPAAPPPRRAPAPLEPSPRSRARMTCPRWVRLVDATTISDEVADYLAAVVRTTRELPASSSARARAPPCICLQPRAPRRGWPAASS